MTMTREEIIQELKVKGIEWISHLSLTAYKGLETSPYIPKFTVVRTEDGYYYVSDDLISFSNLVTGEVFRIRKHWEKQDWPSYTELHQIGKSTGQFRIDIPLYRSEEEFNGHIWEYAELKSPDGNYGCNFNDDVFQWPELTKGLIPNIDITTEYQESVKQYYLEFVDQVSNILHEAKEIAIKNMCGLPLGLSYIFNRYRDDQGYFWSDFDQFTWTRTGTDVLDDAMLYLKGTMEFSKLCGVLTEAQALDVVKVAEEKWKTV
jgi:hypothetical protein